MPRCDAGLYDRPLPERFLLRAGDVDDLAGGLIAHPHLGSTELGLAAPVGIGEHLLVAAPVHGHHVARRRIGGGGQELGELGVFGLDVLDECGEQRLAPAGPVGDPLGAASSPGGLAPGLGVADRTGRDPLGPLLGLLGGPRLHVVVESPHHHQGDVLGQPW